MVATRTNQRSEVWHQSGWNGAASPLRDCLVALAFNLPAQTAQPVEQFCGVVPVGPAFATPPFAMVEAPRQLAQLGASDTPRKPEHTVSSCPRGAVQLGGTIDGSQFSRAGANVADLRRAAGNTSHWRLRLDPLEDLRGGARYGFPSCVLHWCRDPSATSRCASPPSSRGGQRRAETLSLQCPSSSKNMPRSALEGNLDLVWLTLTYRSPPWPGSLPRFLTVQPSDARRPASNCTSDLTHHLAASPHRDWPSITRALRSDQMLRKELWTCASTESGPFPSWRRASRVATASLAKTMCGKTIATAAACWTR